MLLGASLYLAEGMQKNLDFIERMNKVGVKTIFTSLHIPEDNRNKTLDTIKAITKRTNAYGINLITDVSSGTFELYGVEKEEATSFFKDLGINSLRIDYGFSYEEMKKLSKNFQIVLNASIIDDEECKSLEKAGLDLTKITVCHNFYPRENTGLSKEFLFERNKYLKKKGFIIQAFIPGDGERRGPLYAGLPTLEIHREIAPLAAYLDLKQNYLVDEVLIGDISMSENNLEILNEWIENEVITLTVKSTANYLPENFYNVHQNRRDPAADVIRSTQSRITLKNEMIKANHTKERPEGTITIDNNKYGRYKGEIQITKRELSADERVNVLGYIESNSKMLIDYISAGVKFKFLEAK